MKWLVFSVLLFFGCQDTRVGEAEEIDIFYSSQSICDCHRSGVEVLESLIDKGDEVYRTMFQELRANCLTKYGTGLFTPSWCNDPDYIGELIDSLYTIGIDINGPYP